MEGTLNDISLPAEGENARGKNREEIYGNAEAGVYSNGAVSGGGENTGEIPREKPRPAEVDRVKDMRGDLPDATRRARMKKTRLGDGGGGAGDGHE